MKKNLKTVIMVYAGNRLFFILNIMLFKMGDKHIWQNSFCSLETEQFQIQQSQISSSNADEKYREMYSHHAC